jgi:mRNA interferase RelE/StbE
VAEVIWHLPSEVKRGVKGAIRALAQAPDLGDPLLRELGGLWKYRVSRFRVVCSIDRRRRVLRILAVGHRRRIYEEAVRLVRRAAKTR